MGSNLYLEDALKAPINSIDDLTAYYMHEIGIDRNLAELFQLTYFFSRDIAHLDQVRKLDGSDYTNNHSVPVSHFAGAMGLYKYRHNLSPEIIENIALIGAAAIGHDWIEDNPYVLPKTIIEFYDNHNYSQYSQYIANLIQASAKKVFTLQGLQRRLSPREYVPTIIDKPDVVVTLLADRFHNLLTIDGLPPRRQKEIALNTLVYFLPLALSYNYVREGFVLMQYAAQAFNNANESSNILTDFPRPVGIFQL